MNFNQTEQEAIILNAAWSMIDDMVNFAIFLPLDGRTESTNLMPQTTDTQRLFHILLGDFLSPLVARGKSALPFDLPKPEKQSRLSNFTFLFYLRQVSEQPMLGPQADVLSEAVESFSDWLEKESHVPKVWLPSIDVEVDLNIPRITWLKISADIGKHSFARLEGNVRKVVRILRDHGQEIDEGMGYTVLPEFWDWFHSNLFGYHASTVAEFLNNLRWAIFTYLQPEYARSYRVTGDISGAETYVFDSPEEVTSPLARTMYWDLMNMVRARPFFPRFTVTEQLKKIY